MPPARSDTELLDVLTEVFRRHGYEGTTLNRISQATDLQKSSLYYRFPGGKEQMARMVLNSVRQRLSEDVLEPLRHDDRPPRERVEEMASRLGVYFGGGTKACVLDTLSIGLAQEGSSDEHESIASGLRSAFQSLQKAFVKIARQAGKTEPGAERAATEAFIRIEGSLVVSRITGDTDVFERVLDELPGLLCD